MKATFCSFILHLLFKMFLMMFIILCDLQIVGEVLKQLTEDKCEFCYVACSR